MDSQDKSQNDDYPHIRKQFATQWQLDSRRIDSHLEPEKWTAHKRAHDQALEAALTKARNEDAAIRKQYGGGVAEQVHERAQESDSRRDRRQGYEGDGVITHDLLDRVDSDLAHIGQVRDETVAEFERRLNAQFPSEPSPYAGKTGTLRSTLMLHAQKRGHVGAGVDND